MQVDYDTATIHYSCGCVLDRVGLNWIAQCKSCNARAASYQEKGISGE